jgi:hypothetical protein
MMGRPHTLATQLTAAAILIAGSGMEVEASAALARGVTWLGRLRLDLLGSRLCELAFVVASVAAMLISSGAFVALWVSRRAWRSHAWDKDVQVARWNELFYCSDCDIFYDGNGCSRPANETGLYELLAIPPSDQQRKHLDRHCLSPS